MEAKNYSWQTTFETAEETMTTVFSERIKVVTNFRLRTITAIKDDRISYSFRFEEDYSLKDFEQFLVNMAKDSEQLKEFSDGN